MKKKNIKNSKIFHDTMVTLGALKENAELEAMQIQEITVHLLDEDGDGIVLCLEYDKRTGEINKTFHSTDEAAYDEYGENDEVGAVIEVELEDSEPLDPYAKVPNVASKRFEKEISEEYDEIFASRSTDDDEEPGLLN